ncbi:KGGVGR-motif variant AAA ATPase [Amycolatopsis magusensis]|uniref:KGGVGR-motif variant AAA ATPase n=1 Tax=Amycolatopsis magusensis TaxID=882444 RepID=UPI0024A915B1|nr:AAA family ATPase [Amycolatopsis magusensis]MDI5980494.1 AAA family ATPase [Amycolatopsis magusensis]
MTIRFDEAWTGIIAVAETLSDSGTDVTVVRDLIGRVSLIVDIDTIPANLEEEVRQAAGAFAAPVPVRSISDLFDPASILDSQNLYTKRPKSGSQGEITVLEREVVGADWTRTVDHAPAANRVTFYGFKGGVGRSTAAFMLAQHLALIGKCVLVIDLDLESPGLGMLTQRDEDLPDYGVVDFFAESAVGNEAGLDLVTRSKVVPERHNGEVWLAPAGGRPRQNYEYLAKLNRAYVETSTPDGRGKRFGARLEQAVNTCEARVTELSRAPDVVILDSRAGIHDVAATTLTHLGGLNLLFAADNPQTWAGYRALFEEWQKLPNSRQLGERLRMVSSMTPAAEQEEYLDRFADQAQSCFTDTLYEDADYDDLDAFNFSVSDPAAPHAPIPILFHTDLVGLDPIRKPGWSGQPFVEGAFRVFLDSVTELLIGDQR